MNLVSGNMQIIRVPAAQSFNADQNRIHLGPLLKWPADHTHTFWQSWIYFLPSLPTTLVSPVSKSELGGIISPTTAVVGTPISFSQVPTPNPSYAALCTCS